MAEKYAKIMIAVIAIVLIGYGCAGLSSPEARPVSAEMRVLLDSDCIYDNISVNGIDVGGLTKEEAVKKISDELYAPLSEQKIVLEKGNEKKWILDLETLGYTYSVERGVQAAYDYGRDGEDAARAQEIEALAEAPYNVPLYLAYDKGKVGEFLQGITDEISTPAVEPVFSRKDGALTGEDGRAGSALDYEQTLENLIAITDGMHGGMLQLTLSEVQPRFTLAQIQQAHQLIGAFSTPITGSADRDINVKVASGFVNGTVLYPEAVFSTNATIGPTTYERGYREAPVIVGGKLEDGIGGGVCQVSSTLYNAVLFAELEIVQRRNHSMVVGYCPIGRDATLAGDVIDFRFRNNTQFPIYIESYTEGTTLWVKIYGKETRPENRTLEFESVNMGHVSPPAAKETQDTTLPKGKRVTTVAAITGQIVDVYKKVLIDGAVTERIYIDRSTYSARAAEVRVGTGAAEKARDTAAEEKPKQETTATTPQQPSQTDGQQEVQTPSTEPTTDTPTDNPQDKPTDTPADKPEDKPVDTPTENPEGNPTQTPTDKPTDGAAETPQAVDSPVAEPPATEAPAIPPTDNTPAPTPEPAPEPPAPEPTPAPIPQEDAATE